MWGELGLEADIGMQGDSGLQDDLGVWAEIGLHVWGHLTLHDDIEL